VGKSKREGAWFNIIKKGVGSRHKIRGARHRTYLTPPLLSNFRGFTETLNKFLN
jgi:hypothetical protein